MASPIEVDTTIVNETAFRYDLLDLVDPVKGRSGLHP
jgi:hypothetical protein